MKSPVSPRGATDEAYGSQRRAGNPAYPAQMTAGQGIRGANHGSQCPLTLPGLAATARGESAGGGSPPDFLRPVQTPDSCLGVKGGHQEVPVRRDSAGWSLRHGLGVIRTEKLLDHRCDVS